MDPGYSLREFRDDGGRESGIAPPTRPSTRRSRAGESQEYQYRAIQAHQILIVEPPDLRADPCFRHGGDFIDHQTRSNTEPVAFIRLYLQAKQRRRSGIRGFATRFWTVTSI